jgi:hypothetical protein
VLHYFETTGGYAETAGSWAAMLEQPEAAARTTPPPLSAHNNAQLPSRPLLREA